MRGGERGGHEEAHKPISYNLLSHRVRYLLRSSRAFHEVRQAARRFARAQRLARITEGVMIVDTEQTGRMLHELKALGVHVARRYGTAQNLELSVVAEGVETQFTEWLASMPRPARSSSGSCARWADSTSRSVTLRSLVHAL